MKLISQLLVTLALSISGLTVSAQTTSPNLVPLPNHWTTNGQSVAQSYAINQALALSGSDVRINGFDYGYQYNLGNSWTQCTATNQDGSCSWTMTFNPRVDVNVSIRSNTNTQIYGTTHTEIGANTGNRSRDFQYRFTEPRDLLGLGNFNYTASTSSNATVFGMYSRAVYTVDQCSVDPQSSPTCPGYKTYYTNMWDDGYQQVNLPFVFPMYGQTFTTSYMFTNGVVGFLNPGNNFCCSGVNLNQNPGPQWNYAIYGLQADLGPGADSKFWSQVGDGGTSMRYGWDRVYDLGTNNASTFNIQIKDSGYIGINYQSINSQANITAGIAGDISQGQYSQIYHGWAGAFVPNTQYTFTGTEITDQCASNPLYSSTCPGYAQAYFTQQCNANPLYNSQCPGYATAYFNQQCTASALYNTACPGYATAYYNYQCSASALYHTGCPGYATAYFDQQCSLNPLYNSQCPGYADAYYVQQCTANPLSDSGCSGYETAYFNQQCSLDPLYNNQCSGYKEAYALKYIVTEKPKTTETTAVAVTAAAAVPVAVETPVTTAPAVVATASPADSATAPVQLVPQPKPMETAAPVETKKETKATAEATGSSTSSSGSKEQPKTTRQALAERRMEAAREKAAAAAKQNPAAMAAQMDTAGSMEQQVELQAVVLSAMGFVAGFDAYGRSTIPDAAGYKPFEIYTGQRNIDSPAARGLLVRSDRIHQDMVESQYKK